MTLQEFLEKYGNLEDATFALEDEADAADELTTLELELVMKGKSI